MTESPLFKRAFVRGLNTELTRQGVTQYPTKEAADYAADYVADNIGMPDPYDQPNQITTKVAAYICNELVKAGNHLCNQYGQPDPSITKTAQATSPEDSATQDAWTVMEKAAAETGSLMEGGDEENDMPAAAVENAEAALEQARRGENYANMGEDGVGNYERKGEGTIGTEENHPESPKATDVGANSLIEQSNKHGSLRDIVARVSGNKTAATGLMEPGKDQNDMPAAAANNAEAAQEQNRRGENYANKGEKGVGKSDMVPGPAASVGVEQDHSLKPKATDAGGNVVTQHTTKKNAAFEELFTKTAQQVVPYLPENLDDNSKIAHVRAMLGLDSGDRAEYLKHAFIQYGGSEEGAELVRNHFLKNAKDEEEEEEETEEEKEDDGEGLPPALKAMQKEKSDKKDKKDKEEDKEEKEASDNSLSALRAALTNLNK